MMADLAVLTGNEKGLPILHFPFYIFNSDAAGATNRVMLLIGKTYHVASSSPLAVVGRSSVAVEVSNATRKSFDVVWPVTFDIREGVAPTPRPRLGATWNDGGKTFCIIPTPDFLNGRVEWTNDVCCSVWNSGFNYTYACDNTCQCSGCTVYGNYCYEGFSLPVSGMPCGCRAVEDQGDAEIVEFGFTKEAVFYEEPYTNIPGVVVTPQPSNSVLRCVVRGGTYGGTLTVSFDAGASKIVRVSGSTLPSAVSVAAGSERTFEVEYAPIAPSDAMGDIVARAVYVEDFTGIRHEQTASLTSIRIQLTAVYDAPENHNPNRHVYGVGEEVAFEVLPNVNEVVLATTRYDTTDDSNYGYELFGGQESSPVPYVSNYRCPISASYHPPIRVCCGGCEYRPKLTIVEPQEIITTGASWGENAVDTFYDGDRRCWPYGEVGSACLVTTNYVGPSYVSFQGVAVSEVPCDVEDVVTGCFTNGHYRTHVPEAGAGILHFVGERNFVFCDGARSANYESNWIPNSTIVWKIPIGWHRIMPNYYEGRQIFVSDTECKADENSRKLLIGGDIDLYKQERNIDANGTYRTDKFGHWISRSRWCRVILDGQTLQRRHQLQ